jgi:hypothetical protein
MVIKIRLDGNEISEILESFVKKRYPDFDWKGSEGSLTIEGFEASCFGVADLRAEFAIYPDLNLESEK